MVLGGFSWKDSFWGTLYFMVTQDDGLNFPARKLSKYPLQMAHNSSVPKRDLPPSCKSNMGQVTKITLRNRPSQGDFDNSQSAEKERIRDNQSPEAVKLLDELKRLRQEREDLAMKEGRRVRQHPYRCCLCESGARDGELSFEDESLQATESNIDKEIPAANLDNLWADMAKWK
ncbi:hypothetical protein FQN50_008823 [Emmonsiellopsis sp. PD_5]|nr:hypothetical protein FQN50_008823 [Emmonsiellopsis sp. PD_5]